MNPQYSSLANYYDKLNAHIDYEEWADFLVARFKEAGIPNGSLILDLACGTGNITLPLLKRGYDMIAIDASVEMLDCGRKKQDAEKILWLCQDMRSFELYGTVAAVVCCLDSINYLTGIQGLKECFSLVHNYLDPDGLFIFDVNSPYKFKNIYGENHYVMEAPGVYCGWKNHFNRKTGLCDFELSIFVKEHSADRYRRYDELQRERCWSTDTLTALLNNSGFEILSISDGFQMNPVVDTTERIFFTCKAVKK